MVQLFDAIESLQRVWTVGLRVIRQIKRDRRTVMSMAVTPIIMMILLGYALSTTLTGINLGVVELNSGVIQEGVLNQLKASDTFSITYLASESEARKLVSEGKLNGAVVLGNDEIRLILDGTSPQVAGAITSAVGSGMRNAAM